MGARTGQNNFGAHQRRVAEANLLKVRHALDTLSRRRKTDYADLTELIGVVATIAGLHPTTVARSARYRAEILGLVARKPKLLRQASDEVLPLASVQAKAAEAEIEFGQLKRENARLRNMIERRGTEPQPVLSGVDATDNSDRHRRAFERTATVLGRLLAHLAEEEFGIVLDGGRILNTAQVGPRNLIAGPPDTNAYVDWWRRQPTTRDQSSEER